MEKEPDRPEWIEYMGKAFEAFTRDVRGILPEETYSHMRASRREFWLAVRSLIDQRIKNLEKEPAHRVRKLQVR